jgi:diguanylate cyclase (GGDEF)-like protein/PAS domain S-box-containing protein
MMSPTIAAPPAPLAAWSSLIEAMLDAVWLVDAQSLVIKAANRVAGTLMATEPEALIGRTMIELAATPEDLCFWDEVAAGVDDRIESDTLIARTDGGVVSVTRRVSRVLAADGTALFVVALHDRSEHLRMTRELEDTTADLRATLESTHDGILVVDLAGRIRNFNRRFATLWQIPETLLRRRDDDAVLEWMRRSVVDPATYMRRLATMDDATMLQATDELRLHSGTILERVAMPQCMHGRPVGRVFSFRDITEKREADQRIETLSYTDALTGLPNRRLLADRTEVALAAARRDGTPLALLFLNLDRFNHINETLGRAYGDRVLLDVAERIKACVRQVDTIARLGGDEFVVLAHQADDTGAQATAMRLLDALKRPFEQGGMSFTVTASIGGALFPGDGSTMDELLRRADATMREVKRAGRAGYRFHRARAGTTETRSRSRMRLDHAMRMALVQGRFRLHYQPQVDLVSGAVVGAEALIRWRDPELGEIPPGEFIPVAEESGFIVAIGDWVLRRAVTQAAAWRAAGATLTVSVNVSAVQFQQPGFVDGVAEVLQQAGLPPQWLELELTESILIQDAKDAMQRLQALALLGVKLAIDDFGTGYSSLAYLKRFPIRRLKIDRTFVSGLPLEESDVAIVQAIVHMGRALRLEIIAEGVENDAQRQFLQQAGCDLYQGYLFAPALDVAAFEARLGLSVAEAPAEATPGGVVIAITGKR